MKPNILLNMICLDSFRVNEVNSDNLTLGDHRQILRRVVLHFGHAPLAADK